MGWWSNIFKQRAEDWVFISLTQNEVPEEPKSNDEIPFDEAYVTIMLRSMRIVNVRKLTTKFYGVVHSFTTINHLSGKDASFQTITTPSELRKIDPENLDRVIQVNHPLLGPIPYRGGTVGLELGLFSVKEADLAAPFIDVLETMASQAGVSVISMAIPFIQPLKKGIDAIVGTSGESILEVGISTNFDPLKTGWFIIMRARKQDVDVSNLRVTPTDFRLVDAVTNQPIQDYPYMVFTISQSKQRLDWFKLSDLSRPYQELQAAVRKGDYNAVKELIITFRRSALTSDDLITNDATQIAELVTKRAEAVMSGTKTSLEAAGSQRELPPLESYPLYK